MEILLPNSKDIERIVLGTIISNRFGYDEVRDIINEDCFYDDFHKKTYQIFKELESKGEEPDQYSISQEYKKKYQDAKFIDVLDLGELSEVNQVYRHTCRLIDLSTRRKTIELGRYLQQKGHIEQEEIGDIVNYANTCLGSLFSISENHVSTIKEAVKGVYDIIDKNSSYNNRITGSPTGFELFDNKSGGLQKSDLIIIAAETSQGKTSLALSIVNNASQFGEKIAVYSLEMKKEQLAARLMSMNSGIPANQLLYSKLDQIQFERLDQSITGLCNSNILFDDRSTSNIDLIINSIRSMVLKYSIDGVVIDYLQILNVNMKGSNKEQQMADVARRLKNLAKELDIWIVALSQLNRDFNNPVPNLNRLRDSGQIAEAADVVMFVYRPEYYGKPFPEPFQSYQTEGYAMIDVAKGRNIGLLKMLCRFEKETTHFTYVDKDHIPQGTFASNNKTLPF